VLAVPRDLLVFTTPRGIGRLGPTLNDGPQALATESFADYVDQVRATAEIAGKQVSVVA